MRKFIRKIIGTNNLQKNLQTIINAQLFQGTIENSEWLKNKSFTPGGWAMDNAGLTTLFHILNHIKPENILEFGLGQSSKIVHQYANFYENTKAITIEHDSEWIDFFCNGLPKNFRTNIKQIDKEMVKYNGFDTLSYRDIAETVANEKYDLIIVDGPFGSKNYSRSQIIKIAKNNLRKNFCIFMDDSERIGEQETIKEICKVLEEQKIEFLIKEYVGEKNRHTIICSKDMKFLTSLR